MVAPPVAWPGAFIVPCTAPPAAPPAGRAGAAAGLAAAAGFAGASAFLSVLKAGHTSSARMAHRPTSLIERICHLPIEILPLSVPRLPQCADDVIWEHTRQKKVLTLIQSFRLRNVMEISASKVLVQSCALRWRPASQHVFSVGEVYTGQSTSMSAGRKLANRSRPHVSRVTAGECFTVVNA